jgi:hypothetical protein
MSNIPNFEQWGKMNDYLNSIAVSLGSKVDTSTWVGVQKAVRLGLAPDLFPIGTQLKVIHSVYGDIVFDVVAHDYLKSAKDENAHTMTLLCHDGIIHTEIDGAEAFYYAENELPAGTYNFTLDTTYNSWAAGTYQFTLTKALPKGGQLCISGDASSGLTSRKVQVYDDQLSTILTEDSNITVGNNGTSLGTFGIELNDTSRIIYGSNNYKESAIRQFLNSSAESGKVWTPQTKFDRPPTRIGSMAGFMKGFDVDFLSVVGEVVVPCVSNSVYESPDSTISIGTAYTVTDKFCLASRNEIFGTTTVLDESMLLPYYKQSVANDRIKYNKSAKSAWWLRTPSSGSCAAMYIVSQDGNLLTSGSMRFQQVAPMCSIV